MQTVLFDPFHGAAGDMITGALLDLGADRELVIRAMESVVGEPSISTVDRAGIRAIRVETHATPVRRTLDEVLSLVGEADAPAQAVAMATRVFRRIGEAEESVHGKTGHFHEVGADDAIADILGACTALTSLRVGNVGVLPFPTGRGTVEGSHGQYPIPAPATAAILAKSCLVTRFEGEETELVTPTGAALLAEFVSGGNGEPRDAVVRGVGYGAGARNPVHVPNVLRAVLLESVDGLSTDEVEILETSLDDVTGEVIAHSIARLMDAGARDASAIPCIMKKGRPGYLVRVISPPGLSRELAARMAIELGTLGIRCQGAVHRWIARRTIERVRVGIGGKTREMPVKCGWLDGTCYLRKAEFDDARAWAEELGLPIREVLRRIEEQAAGLSGCDEEVGGE